jgi:starvation-inducible DNA-binding protein
MKEFAKHARLKETPDSYPAQKAMINELLHDHETVIMSLRDDIDVCSKKSKDVGTIDFLTGILQQHETTAWVLRRYLN